MAQAKFDLARLVTLSLLVNELVTNALKHAFPADRSGTIRYGLREIEGSRLELTVEDDGVGLPPALDPTRPTSLGLELVHTFADQLSAEVEVRRDAGTRFVLRFPRDRRS